MTEKNTRYIQVGDWYFEVKSVKAIRVDEYGKPYTAVANCSFNGDTMYVDGLLTKDDHDFTKQDYKDLYEFSRQMGVEQVNYHRYHHGKSATRDVEISANSPLLNENATECANEGTISIAAES